MMIGDLQSGPITAQAFKVAENNSPRPTDRVYATFNYYNNVTPVANAAAGLGRFDMYVETVGIVKTLVDGLFSVEARLPIDTLHAGIGTATGVSTTETDVGDLSVIAKIALLNDCDAGNALSVGVLVTFPTGRGSFAGFNPLNLPTPAHDDLFQPFVGYICTCGCFYIQGFTSLSIPSRDSDTMILFNDIGVGYYLFRAPSPGCFLTAVIPTLELHVNTPLTHRDAPVVDSVDLTEGLIFEACNCAWLTVGVSENVSGPKQYDTELIVQLNVRF
jgi:hypothetical protein